MSDGGDTSDSASDEDPFADVGSVADEAAKLADALSGWAHGRSDGLADQLFGLLGHAGATWTEVNEHIATDDTECHYCPVCRAISLWRQTTPEVKEHLGQAAASAFAALSAAMHTETPRTRPQRSGRVQNIAVDDESDSEDRPAGGADGGTDDSEPGAP